MKPNYTQTVANIEDKLIKIQQNLEDIKKETFSKNKTRILAAGYASLGLALALTLEAGSSFKASEKMTLLKLGTGLILFLISFICIHKSEA